MTGAVPLSAVRAWRGQIAPIAAITVFGLSISMSYPLLGLLLERMGASGFWIGVNTTAAAISMVAFAPILPRIMARTGLGPLMLGSGLGLAVIMIGYAAWPDYAWWTVLRVFYGFCATAVFFTSEFWIVAAAPAGRRGRVVAIYTMSLSASFMAGPLVIGATGVDGLLPFVVATTILLAGLVPVLWGLGAVPPASAEDPPHPRATLKFFVTDPSVVWAVVLFGLIEYGTVALLPVWAVRTGFSEQEAAWVMASFAAGSLVFAPLMGWLADRADRRRLLAIVAGVAVAAPLAIGALSESLVLVLLTGLAWGGTAAGLYTLPLVELGARYSGHRLAEGNAAVILGYGIGALVSPAALGAAMDAVPPHGLLLVSSAAALAYLGLLAARILLGKRRPLDPPADSGT